MGLSLFGVCGSPRGAHGIQRRYRFPSQAACMCSQGPSLYRSYTCMHSCVQCSQGIALRPWLQACCSLPQTSTILPAALHAHCPWDEPASRHAGSTISVFHTSAHPMDSAAKRKATPILLAALHALPGMPIG